MQEPPKLPDSDKPKHMQNVLRRLASTQGLIARRVLLGLFVLTLGASGCCKNKEVKAPPPPEAPDERFIFFGPGRADVKQDAYYEIGYVAAQLEDEPRFHLLIVGHADQHGKSEFNKQISFRRALAVRKVLVDKGVDENRILVAAPREGDEGTMTQLSRRVDLFVYDPLQEEVATRLGYPLEVRQK